MAKFWELFAESVIIQALLALLFGGTIAYMYVAGMEVPDTLVNAFMIILGFYFGGKSTIAASRKLEK